MLGVTGGCSESRSDLPFERLAHLRGCLQRIRAGPRRQVRTEDVLFPLYAALRSPPYLMAIAFSRNTSGKIG